MISEECEIFLEDNIEKDTDLRDADKDRPLVKDIFFFVNKILSKRCRKFIQQRKNKSSLIFQGFQFRYTLEISLHSS